MTALSVNVNKFALIRNARGADLPNLYDISKKCIEFGADGITVHPRPDERHIRYKDVFELKNKISKSNINIDDYYNELLSMSDYLNSFTVPLWKLINQLGKENKTIVKLHTAMQTFHDGASRCSNLTGLASLASSASSHCIIIRTP